VDKSHVFVCGKEIERAPACRRRVDEEITVFNVDPLVIRQFEPNGFSTTFRGDFKCNTVQAERICRGSVFYL